MNDFQYGDPEKTKVYYDRRLFLKAAENAGEGSVRWRCAELCNYSLTIKNDEIVRLSDTSQKHKKTCRIYYETEIHCNIAYDKNPADLHLEQCELRDHYNTYIKFPLFREFPGNYCKKNNHIYTTHEIDLSQIPKQ
jgi:hypothetical protein